MSVHGVDHVNIRVKDPMATMNFLADVLGMTVKVSPPGSLGGGGLVIDANGNAILHVGAVDGTYPSDTWRPFKPAEDGGAVHHVALNCGGYDEVRARIKALGLDHFEGEIPQIKLKQLFTVVPGGVLLELNFRDA
ncbi:MAG: glyoxalase/bleomycin resistance/extradiol dioxygenase family protein [Rhodospirillaceae bacterium]|nr:MAG: glyoxalase/bleomycin resistance/extradiol dioxygenase family protein [Rhodospirillaceae bacterium]